MTEDLKILESLGYRPDTGLTGKIDKEPTSAPPETLGFNSHVIKPESRVNNAEDAEQEPERHKIECVANMTGEENTCDCGIKQPNLKIIEAIGCLVSQINDRLGEIIITNKEPGDSIRKLRRNQALKDNDLFQKTMRELRKAFKD